MNKQQLAKKARLICKVIIVVLAIYGIYQAVQIYKYFQMYPQTSFEWAYSKPEELVIKVSMILKLKRTLVIGTLIYILYAIADYIYKPEGHFFQAIKEFLKPVAKILDKMEDEENENIKRKD